MGECNCGEKFRTAEDYRDHLPCGPVKLTHPDGEWIGVDFDRTLATYVNWETNGNSLGTPILPMVERIKRWLASGMKVKVFTARVASTSFDAVANRERIQAWCEKHLGTVLEVTAEKDFNMVELWDDRAVRVEENQGTASSPASYDPLTVSEELQLWRKARNRNEVEE